MVRPRKNIHVIQVMEAHVKHLPCTRNVCGHCFPFSNTPSIALQIKVMDIESCNTNATLLQQQAHTSFQIWGCFPASFDKVSPTVVINSL